MSGFGTNGRPDSWDDLEEAVAEVVAHVWGDPDATRVGRDDQRRHAVDVLCRPDHLEGDHCAIQCRVTDELDADAVREAAETAENLGTALSEFVVATTASREASVDDEVRSLAEERAGEGRFPVRLLWWGDVVRLLGNAAHQVGNVETAEERYRAALAEMRDVGDRRGEADALEDLGAVALGRGDFEAAGEHYRDCLDRREETDDEHGEATARYRLGLVARERDDWETAREQFQAASEQFLEISAGRDALDVLADLVEAHGRTGHESDAVDTCGLAIAIAEEMEAPEIERRFRVEYASLPGRDVAEGTDELYTFALEDVVDPDPDAAIALFDRTWNRREEVPAGSATRARTHAAGVFLAALAELYDLQRGDEAVDPDDLLAAATDGDVDLPEPVEPVATRLRGEDPGVTPDDVDGDVTLGDDGDLGAEDLEKLAAAAVLEALG